MRTIKVTPGYIRQIIAEERELMLEHDRYRRVLVREGTRMRTDGYSQEEINEGILAIAQSLGGGFLDVFKHDIAQQLLMALGIQPEGILSKIISNIVERTEILKFKEYFSPGGCKKFADVIMDSLLEATVIEPLVDGLVDKLGINPDSRLYASVREAGSNWLLQKDGGFAQELENKIADFVCNLDISNIFGGFKKAVSKAGDAGGGIMDKVKGFFGGGDKGVTGGLPASEATAAMPAE